MLVEIRPHRLFGQMKTLGESAYRLVMLSVFMPKRLGRRLGVVYKLYTAGGTTVSLLSSEMTVFLGV